MVLIQALPQDFEKGSKFTCCFMSVIEITLLLKMNLLSRASYIPGAAKGVSGDTNNPSGVPKKL